MPNRARRHAAALPGLDLLLNVWSSNRVSPARAEAFDPGFELVFAIGRE
jgi:hypothetical protein